MKQFIQSLYDQLNEDIASVELEEDHVLRRTEQCIALSEKHLLALKGFILDYQFIDKQEEILFFKELKPLFHSKLLYFSKVFDVELNRPTVTDEIQRRYLEKQLDELHLFFEHHLDFYKYYRMGAIYLDDKYFLRGNYDIRLGSYAHHFDLDKRFSSSHDLMVSTILANELLRIYLNSAIDALDRSRHSGMLAVQQGLVETIQWTAAKAELTELIYALQARGVFNHGQADIKQITDYFEAMFSIDLGNVYRVFQELRIRKKGRTVFVSSLVDTLTRRMDEADL